MLTYKIGKSPARGHKPQNVCWECLLGMSAEGFATLTIRECDRRIPWTDFYPVAHDVSYLDCVKHEP